MKKLTLVILLLLSLGANYIFANPIQSFAEKVAYSTFKTAWPTASYNSVEVFEHEETSTGHDIVVRLEGKSNICKIGKCILRLDLEFSTDHNYIIQDVEVIKHNAIVQKPFKTVNSIKNAVIRATQ